MNENDEEKTTDIGTRIRKILILIVVMGVLTAAGASLQVKQVRFEGNVHYSSDQLEEILLPEGEMRNPVYFILMTYLRRTPRLPFVKGYSVLVTGPESLRITIHEKELAGYTEVEGQYLYFDSKGSVVEVSDTVLEDILAFTGVASEPVEEGKKLPVESDIILEEILNISQFLKAGMIEQDGVRTPLSRLTERVAVDSRANVTVTIGEIDVYLGNQKYMEEKLLTMKDILPKIMGRSGTLYLDNYDPNAENPAYVFK